MPKSKLLFEKNRWWVMGLLTTAVVFLILLLSVDRLELSLPGQLMARFHPLILHFPIVLVFILTVFEVLELAGINWINERAKTGLLILMLLSTVGSIVSGFLLFHSGDYSGELIQRHFYGAIFSGVILLLSSVLYLLAITGKWQLHKFYLISLCVGMLSILFTSHSGGSVTHGSDFLTEPLTRWQDSQVMEIQPVEEMLVFDDVVMAFLEVKCMSCHNPNKKKGGLLLSDYPSILHGGDSKRAGVRPADLEGSEIWSRVTLAPDHEDHMPPEGKTPLDELEKEILRLWVENGASDTLKVGEVSGPFHDELAIYIPQIRDYHLQKYQSKEEFETAVQKLAPLATSLGLESGVYDLGTVLLVSIAIKFPPEVLDDERLKELSPYFSMIGKMSLAGSGVTDDGAFLIGKMQGLRELYIQKTKITSQGLAYLQNLPNLEILNLSDTEIDDTGLLELVNFPALKTVYLAGTKINKPVLDAVRKVHPDIEFLLEEGPYF